MRVPIASLFLAWSAAAAGETDPAAPPPTLDPRVQAALATSSVAYANDGGDFRLIDRLDNGRTQVVWIASATARITKLELRDVWSLAYRGNGQVPPEMAKRLLTENARMVLGAWQVNQSSDKFLIVYLAQIPADADAAALHDVVEAVAVSADRIEKELTDADEF